MVHLGNILKVAAVGLALIPVTACQHTSVGTPSPFEQEMRNTVQMVRLPYSVAVEEDATTGLSPKTEREIASFLASVQAGYGDVVLLDGPSTSPHRITAIADFIKARGLAFAGTATMGPAPETGVVILYVERYRVITPDCGGWEAEVSNQQRNNDSANLGCANTTNLGLMVANPRDLVSGASTGNSTTSAVGAIYNPAPQTSGPTMTLSLDGMGALAGGTAAVSGSK
ncbi:CpaD family pilus assembly lipoprotein [Kordiimonas pumila]|uniref:CpaD family pilus assembly lipoprotein n=1 Tax=Kordiimonas pumila TaxID=2161677 RepID=A0ABV7D5R5_9PROT|nr:CpaD family pilus assembly lipoprotein [Kordiimonas pumila]